MSVWVDLPTPVTFIHLEKTGGTSIQEWLLTNTSAKRVGKHSSYEKMQSWANKANKELGTVFTVVRNPFIREVSWYTYFIQKTRLRLKWAKLGHTHYPEILSEKKIKTKYDIEKNTKLLDQFAGHNGFYKFVRTRSKLQPQYHTALKCDITLRLENIDSQFKEIKNLCNCGKELPHLNKSHHKYYTVYYNDATISYVYKKHKKDFEYFGYTFD